MGHEGGAIRNQLATHSAASRQMAMAMTVRSAPLTPMTTAAQSERSADPARSGDGRTHSGGARRGRV